MIHSINHQWVHINEGNKIMAKNKVDSVLILLSFHSVEGMDKKEFQIEVVIGRKQGEVTESRVRESDFREGGQREVFLGRWYSNDENQPWENLDRDSPGKGNTLYKSPRQELQLKKGSQFGLKAMNNGRWYEMRPKVSCRAEVMLGFVGYAEKLGFYPKDSG